MCSSDLLEAMLSRRARLRETAQRDAEAEARAAASEAEIRALAAWIRDHLGPGTPLHLTAFHPAHRMLALPPTPLQTLRQARRWALEEGLAFVYTGNLPDAEGTTTWCPRCGLGLIHRERHRATISQLAAGTCPGCGHLIPGRWA